MAVSASPARGSGPTGWTSCLRSCPQLVVGSLPGGSGVSCRPGLLLGLTRLSCALQPGDIHSDPKNNCTFFSCVKIHNQLISSVSNITCPDFDPSICIPVSGGPEDWDLSLPTPWQVGVVHGWGAARGSQAHSPSFQGSITLMPNGCCKKCEYKLVGDWLLGTRCGWAGELHPGPSRGRDTGNGVTGILCPLCHSQPDVKFEGVTWGAPLAGGWPRPGSLEEGEEGTGEGPVGPV